MLLRELKKMVESTADAAFAVDGAGVIVAWNQAAERLFGRSVGEVLGQTCGSIVQGSDECGPVCNPDCSIQQAARCHHQVRNFDLHVQTQQGARWCNISVLIAEVANSTLSHSIHLIRPVDTRKRLELLMRDFIVTETSLPAEEVKALVSSTRSPVRETELTKRELEILRRLAKGATTEVIAAELHISRTTVNNHIQHLLHKLNAHTRLEAIRRAELGGLI
jgi:PAS domain S-box-containing protein